MNRILPAFAAALLTLDAVAVPVSELGLKGDGNTDDTAALNAALERGVRELEFGKGEYLLGTVAVPSNTTLRFAKDASIKISVSGITEADGGEYPLFNIAGDDVLIEGLTVDGASSAFVRRGKGIVPALTSIIHAKKRENLRFSGIRSRNSEVRGKSMPSGIHLVQCSGIEGRDGEFSGISFCYMMIDCVNASIHGNRATDCNTITSFTRGSEGLRHYDNWSRNVVYQCVFRGGLPDPSRKAPSVPLGSSKIAIRDLDIENTSLSYYKDELAKIGASGVVLDDKNSNAEQWHTSLSGTYDIQIVNNYAEYGRTLAWGNRGRDVIFAGNVSRFMTDYAYGVEGCENVVYVNNISINSRSAGIMSMYWGDKLVLCGNMVLIRDEPYRPEFGWLADQSGYWGGFFRFHHGPGNADDYAAGSDYGSGTAIVSGNLFVNELTDRVRGVSLESGRDVTISGNKFVNGCIRKSGTGTVSVLSNEFVSYMPVEHQVVSVGGNEMFVSGNVMRYIGGGKRMQLKEMAADGTDAAENALDDEKLAEKLPAVYMKLPHRGGILKRLIVKGNTIAGWTDASMRLEFPALPPRTVKPDVLIRDNDVEGAIMTLGDPANFRLLEFGNADLRSFQVAHAVKGPVPTEVKR